MILDNPIVLGALIAAIILALPCIVTAESWDRMIDRLWRSSSQDDPPPVSDRPMPWEKR